MIFLAAVAVLHQMGTESSILVDGQIASKFLI